jgi:hypothetical protein
MEDAAPRSSEADISLIGLANLVVQPPPDLIGGLAFDLELHGIIDDCQRNEQLARATPSCRDASP